MCLVTYGSPLQRLNARYFPAYFGPDTPTAIGRALAGGAPVAAGAIASEAERAFWPWRNLYRSSDPIGGPVFRPCSVTEACYPGPAAGIPEPDAEPVEPAEPVKPGLLAVDDVDWQLLDPMFPIPPGSTDFPATYGHSDYFLDAYYEQSIGVVRKLRG